MYLLLVLALKGLHSYSRMLLVCLLLVEGCLSQEAAAWREHGSMLLLLSAGPLYCQWPPRSWLSLAGGGMSAFFVGVTLVAASAPLPWASIPRRLSLRGLRHVLQHVLGEPSPWHIATDGSSVSDVAASWAVASQDSVVAGPVIGEGHIFIFGHKISFLFSILYWITN